MDSKIYYPHDNGGRFYKVIIKTNSLTVMKLKKKLKDDVSEYGKRVRDFDREILKNIKFDNIFIGKNTNKFGSSDTKNSCTGNSILVGIKDNNYMYIGTNIYLFKTDKPIIKFYSIVGRSDVVYSFAYSDNKLYLLIESVYMNVDDWNKKDDPYDLYYNKKSGVKFTKYKTKIINKRFS